MAEARSMRRPKADAPKAKPKTEAPPRPQIEANPERGQRGDFVKITVTIAPEMLERILTVGVQRKARKAGEPSATSEMIREAIGEWLEQQ